MIRCTNSFASILFDEGSRGRRSGIKVRRCVVSRSFGGARDYLRAHLDRLRRVAELLT